MTSPVAGFALILGGESSDPPSCGTMPAYRLHRKRGEHCDTCWPAMAAIRRGQRQKQKPGCGKVQSVAATTGTAPALDADRYPCAESPDLWFSDRPADIKQAKKGCLPCAALLQCRSWALARDEAGVWGGLSERERRKIRRKSA